MKKLILIWCLLGVCWTAFTQDSVNFGVKAGGNAASHAGTGLVNDPNNNIYSFHLGVFGQLPLTSDVLLSPEILYTNKGFKRRGIIFQSPYIDFSLLSKINLGDSQAYCVIGPYVSYQLEKEFLYTTSQKTYDFGGNLGIGFRIQKHLRIEAIFQTSANVWTAPRPMGEGYRLTQVTLSALYLIR
ncbi:outer membrane beta-barrel protein [Flectobacillus longus]|uniref:outer membrane beta-barrel protein n=1 Tax=Flectobacillus longus TaxID=2984207 RepID=UPI0024B7E29D|nr:outer membrane beta-barrel protein [Flectobacillus longus]MDI9877845.1 outer membrane beta-barrel protein [Flectobacillus longus]